MNTFIHWLEDHLLSCPYKSILGVDCPGCGFQRAFIELLKGNLKDSFYLYPALLPILFLLVFVILHLKFKFKNGAAIVKYTFIVCTGIVAINYFSKLFL